MLLKAVNIHNYILNLIKRYHEDNGKDKEILLEDINRAIDSSLELRKKKDLIEQFIQSLEVSADVVKKLKKFFERFFDIH